MGFDPANLILFMGASLLLIITPGPDMIFVITRGISQGRIAGILSASGVCCGVLVHTLAAALGLAILLKTSAIAYYTIKYLGATYLVYLGIKTFTGEKNFSSLKYREKKAYHKLFLQGFLTDVLNPKIALFFISFLPQFVNNKSALASLQSITLGLIYFTLSLAILSLIALLSAQTGNLLFNNTKFSQKISRASGSVLFGLGCYLAIPGRN